MTLFFVSQDLQGDEAPETSRAARILSAAIEAFESQPRH